MLCNEPKKCSASHMFVSWELPTCKMLIRNFFSFIKSVSKSGNAILQSIMNSDAIYTSPLYHHWRDMLYVQFLVTNIQSGLLYGCNIPE